MPKFKSRAHFEHYIDDAWTHLQAYYCHDSLGTKATTPMPLSNEQGKKFSKTALQIACEFSKLLNQFKHDSVKYIFEFEN